MKIFLKIILLSISILFIFDIGISFADCKVVNNRVVCSTWNDITNINWYNWWVSNKANNHLNNIKWNSSSTAEFIVSWNANWDQWIYNFIVRIARDLKNLVFAVSTIYFLFIVFNVLTSENTEEEVSKFKKWIIWISIWIFVMQIAYSFVQTLSRFNSWLIGQSLWWELYKNVIDPIVRIIEMWSWFVFIAIAIYAFYKMVTANWNEENAKKWKWTIFYAILWFIVIKFSRLIVDAVYWKIHCWSNNSIFIFQNETCLDKANLSDFWNIVITIINWMNSFVWIITLIMIIYAWAQVLFSGWDEEKLKKAKKAILYIAIWLGVLIVNYLILSFFFSPEKPI